MIARGFLALLLATHRPAFIGATTVLAIATSRVAAQQAHTADWVMLVGAILLMWASDAGVKFEVAAQELVRSARGAKPIGAARMGVLSGFSRWSLSIVWLAGVGAIVTGLLLATLAHSHSSGGSRTHLRQEAPAARRA